MMSVDKVIDGILDREGEGTPPYLDKNDRGGRTRFGIDERSHPEAWRNGPPTRDEARAIYARTYVAPFDPIASIVSDSVHAALIDDAVLSGVQTATKGLQRVLGLGVRADGVIGPETIAGVEEVFEEGNGEWLLIRLALDRAHRLARIVEQDHEQARFIVGWIDRALSFLG